MDTTDQLLYICQGVAIAFFLSRIVVVQSKPASSKLLAGRVLDKSYLLDGNLAAEPTSTNEQLKAAIFLCHPGKELHRRNCVLYCYPATRLNLI